MMNLEKKIIQIPNNIDTNPAPSNSVLNINRNTNKQKYVDEMKESCICHEMNVLRNHIDR